MRERKWIWPIPTLTQSLYLVALLYFCCRFCFFDPFSYRPFGYFVSNPQSSLHSFSTSTRLFSPPQATPKISLTYRSNRTKQLVRCNYQLPNKELGRLYGEEERFHRISLEANDEIKHKYHFFLSHPDAEKFTMSEKVQNSITYSKIIRYGGSKKNNKI